MTTRRFTILLKYVNEKIYYFLKICQQKNKKGITDNFNLLPVYQTHTKTQQFHIIFINNLLKLGTISNPKAICKLNN